ncbi:alpha/beta hydrolase [Afifella sp. YEN Y35]|uniref:alpha/beta hydrolase n=1 Tax=Afifella sp. YEN Y35 TaxID=3388337 RepID=UPI0039E1366B
MKREQHAWAPPQVPPTVVRADGCTGGRLISEEGRAYNIFLYRPNAPAPPTGYPVIFLLDADTDFLLVTETVRRLSRRPAATGVPPLVVAGIGFPEGERDLYRYFDLTEGPPANDPFLRLREAKFGGASLFAAFLQTTVASYVAGEVPVDPAKSVLFGHSLAGFFVLDRLARAPGRYFGSIAISPSIWWNRAHLMEALPAIGAAGSLYAAIGEWEEELAPWQRTTLASPHYTSIRHERRMVSNFRELGDRLTKSAATFSALFETYPDEDHASVLAASLARALRFIFTKQRD